MFITWTKRKAAAMSKQTTITIETTSLVIVRSGTSHRAWCPRCAAEAEMLRLEELRVVSTFDQLVIERWLDASGVHRCDATDGTPQICLSSLLARVQNPNRGSRDIPRTPNP